jgi:hypothetical protein
MKSVARRTHARRLISALLAAVLLAGCDLPESQGRDPYDEDASAQFACASFYDLADEADLLTDVEIRERLLAVWDDAQVSTRRPVREAARDMLAAITDGETRRFERAVSRMGDACANVEPL